MIRLDRDNLGEVPILDFFDGLKRMQGSAQSKDVVGVFLVLQDILRELRPGGEALLFGASSLFFLWQSAGP